MMTESDLVKMRKQYNLLKPVLKKNPMPGFLSRADKEALINISFLANNYHGGKFHGIYRLSRGNLDKLSKNDVVKAANEFAKYKNSDAQNASKKLLELASKWEAHQSVSLAQNPKIEKASEIREALETEAKRRKIPGTVEVPERRYGANALSFVQDGKILGVAALSEDGFRWVLKDLRAEKSVFVQNVQGCESLVARTLFNLIEESKSQGHTVKYKGFSFFSNPSTYYFELSSNDAKLIAKKGFDEHKSGWYVCHQNKCYGPFSKQKAADLFDHAKKTGKFPATSEKSLVSEITLSQNPQENTMSDKTQAQIKKERLKNLAKARAVRMANLKKEANLSSNNSTDQSVWCVHDSKYRYLQKDGKFLDSIERAKKFSFDDALKEKKRIGANGITNFSAYVAEKEKRLKGLLTPASKYKESDPFVTKNPSYKTPAQIKKERLKNLAKARAVRAKNLSNKK